MHITRYRCKQNTANNFGLVHTAVLSMNAFSCVYYIKIIHIDVYRAEYYGIADKRINRYILYSRIYRRIIEGLITTYGNRVGNLCLQDKIIYGYWF